VSWGKPPKRSRRAQFPGDEQRGDKISFFNDCEEEVRFMHKKMLSAPLIVLLALLFSASAFAQDKKQEMKQTMKQEPR